MDIEQVKKGLLKTLDSIDREKLSLYDLRTYAEIVKIASEIQTKNYMDTLVESMSKASSGFNGYKAPTVGEMK